MKAPDHHDGRTDRSRALGRRIPWKLLYVVSLGVGAGLLTPFVDNGAHIGGALGGAFVARFLHPVVLSPLVPEQAARVRRWLGVIAAVLAYALLGWVYR